jgi:hypothetical protein
LTVDGVEPPPLKVMVDPAMLKACCDAVIAALICVQDGIASLGWCATPAQSTKVLAISTLFAGSFSS